MSEHPIRFIGESVRAILDDRKSQTRRVIVPQPEWQAAGWKWTTKKVKLSAWPDIDDFLCELVQYCPYGKVGDLLWVKEIFRYARIGLGCGGSATCVDYKVDNGLINFKTKAGKYTKLKSNKDKQGRCAKWRSPIFMPKWAARIWLETTGIRVEKINEISNKDIICEGFDTRDSFYNAIIRINKAKNIEQFLNKWVRVISFKRAATH